MKSQLTSVVVATLAVLLWRFLIEDDSDIDIQKVLKVGETITTRSWEFGTFSQALLEYQNPELTIFTTNPFSDGYLSRVANAAEVPALFYAQSLIWTNATELLTDGEGSAGDPASLGIPALLLSSHDPTYLEAARRQAEYLVHKAKKFAINETHSAISHREDTPELWGDFIFMVPPFLAYYGVATQDILFLESAVLQCELYDKVLRTDIVLEDGSMCRGLWRHVVSDPFGLEPGVCCSDRHVWLTSNAWAVAGMTRVLAVVTKWQPPALGSVDQHEYEGFRERAQSVLDKILADMLDCTERQVRDSETGLLRNYLDGTTATSAQWAYGDTAGTALVASSLYRLALLLPRTYAQSRWLSWAEKLRMAVFKHVDASGRVSPVADVGHVPSKTPVEVTSEGQSMVALMYSAWRDCVDAGVCAKTRAWNRAVHRLLERIGYS